MLTKYAKSSVICIAVHCTITTPFIRPKPLEKNKIIPKTLHRKVKKNKKEKRKQQLFNFG